MGPFDRFNDRAKRVLALAQDEAIRFNHNYIGPEHLLLGLIREREGVAAHVLDSLGIELSAARRAVEFEIGRGDSTTIPSDITLSPRTKRIIELALDEARKLGHSHVGTEHLLLAIVRVGAEGSDSAGKVLADCGIELEQVRQTTIATLGRQHPASTGAPPEVIRELFDAQGRKRDWYCEDVLTGKKRVNVIWEDERVMAMEHPYPQYVLHGVVIPKKHVVSLLADEALDGELLTSMLRGVQAVAKAVGLDQHGFQLQANAAAPGVTPHMHWHVVGPGLPPPVREAQGGGWQRSETAPARRTLHGGPFDRFDDTAKRVLAHAQEESIRLKHNYIGTEHLLLGLVRGENDIGSRVLAELGVELSKVRTAVEFIIGRGDAPTTPSDITLSPRTKKVIELAIDESRRLGHDHVTSGHMLLGLVREGEGIASGVLESLGVALPTVRQKVLEIMGKRGS